MRDLPETDSLAHFHHMELLQRARSLSEAGVKEPYAWDNAKAYESAGEDITDELWFAVRFEYRWRETVDGCMRDVVDIVAPSNDYRSYGIIITAWVCQDNLDAQQQEDREEILSSFEIND